MRRQGLARRGGTATAEGCNCNTRGPRGEAVDHHRRGLRQGRECCNRHGGALWRHAGCIERNRGWIE